jgi:hypothetical protein
MGASLCGGALGNPSPTPAVQAITAAVVRLDLSKSISPLQASFNGHHTMNFSDTIANLKSASAFDLYRQSIKVRPNARHRATLCV